ncbi:MAG: glycosyltransferase family 39 protein [Ginsengibacter sp.]
MHKPGLSSCLYSHSITVGLVLIICFYLINGISYLHYQSITSDEGSFYSYATRYLKGNPERIVPDIDNSKMPVTLLNTIPRLTEQVFAPGIKKNDGGFSDLMHGRYVTLLVSVLTILLVFVWSSELYGKKAGLFSSCLMSICPNNMANATFVTTDSYSVLLLVVSMYFLWKFCTIKTGRYFIFFSMALALSQLVKQSLFHLYVLAPVCMIIYFSAYSAKFKYGLFFKRLFLFLLINWFIINLGFYFYKSFLRLGDYHFMSHLFQGIQSMFPQSMLLPLPKPFVDGLDMAKYYDQLGGGYDLISSFGNVTILGHSKTGGGYWYYYFVSLFYKTPLTYFVFIVWSIILLLKTRTFKEFISREFFLMAPVIYFLIVFSFFYQTQCGLRHIIFIYPFFFILSGIIVPNIKKGYQKISVIVLSLLLIISVLRYWKNYYPYTNEFIADKKMAFEYVGSSNLEFKQGRFFLQQYLRDHSDVRLAPVKPQVGTFVIGLQDYMDIWNRHQYDWIQRFKPIGHVAYTYLLIKVEEKNIKP